MDFAFLPRRESGNRPAILVELKVDKTAETAIRQILERRYTGALQQYKGEIIIVGLSYDRESKQHTCEIRSIKNI